LNSTDLRPDDILARSLNLTALVAKASAAILRFAGARPRHKADGSPVTDADEAAEAVILDGISQLLPGIPVIAEESIARRAPPALDGAFVLVDPLDGTKEFIAGRDEYTVNLALISGRRPIAGFVAAPGRALLWRGIVGHGAERLAIEGETVPGETRPEGPFGEWMGYYSDDTQERPFVRVKTILHRNDPILTCAPQHRPVDETGLLKGIAGAAQIWRALEACGIPDVLGVWNHEAGPATRFSAIQIRQRYPGHARQALHVACACQGGAYAGKWTVVVDDDIDAGDLDQVLWAMCTRFDPKVDIDLVQKAWASKRDPLYLPGNFNNRILIDACIPYDMKLKGAFPQVVDVSADLRAKLRAKFPKLFN